MAGQVQRLALVFLLGTACRHAGHGEGVLVVPESTPPAALKPRGPVRFTWETEGPSTEGKLHAKLSDGRAFDGTFLQVTAESRHDNFGPYWGWWSTPEWGAWGPWYSGPQTGFATYYTGQVLAHLKGSDGNLMRCGFILRDPMRGLSGGAMGECQLTTQEQILHAELAPR